MAMDRTQLILVALPLFLLCSDIFNLFAPPPPKAPRPPPHHHHHHPHPHHPHHPHPHPHPHHPHPHHAPSSEIQQASIDFLTQKASGVGAIGFGNTVKIDFCASCSYRGTAVTMEKMLATQFPGIDVHLANYPPALPKRALSKLVPVAQMGVMAIVLGGEHIFPRLGFAAPPPWYYSLRANRFGTISSTWLLGNFLQSFLQSSGAFEVYCNGDLVFSKLKEGRFPGEIELKDLISRRIASSRAVDDFGGV